MARQLGHQSGTGARAETASGGGESLADRLLTFVAMGGAVAGAVAGAGVGAEIGSAFPVACGGLGTMLGSGFAAGMWCLFADLWSNGFVGYEDGHVRDHAAAEQVNPSSSAG